MLDGFLLTTLLLVLPSAQEATAPPSPTPTSPFENVSLAEYRVTSSADAAAPALRLYFSRTAFRVETGTTDRPAAVIGSFSDPDAMYLIKDNLRIYSKLASPQNARRRWEESTYVVQVHDGDSIAGIECRKATVRWSTGEVLEACLAPGIAVSNDWLLAQTLIDARVLDALRAAGAEGLAVRWSALGKERTSTIELTKLDQAVASASRFQVPPGYDLAPAATPIRPVDGVCENVEAPLLIHRVEPEYPEDARKERLEGRVVIEAIIATDGSVDAPRILQTPYYSLGQFALTAVKKWRYKPALCAGKPIRVYLTVTSTFRLDGKRKSP
jgi:TonB family protein